MTEYTEVKRGLQALGFKIVARKGDKDVILSKDDTKIRLVDDTDTGALTYAATRDSIPVSWHNGSPRCHEPGMYVGRNNHIEIKNESDLRDEEYRLFCIMCQVAHKGQWFDDLNAEW